MKECLLFLDKRYFQQNHPNINTKFYVTTEGDCSNEKQEGDLSSFLPLFITQPGM